LLFPNFPPSSNAAGIELRAVDGSCSRCLFAVAPILRLWSCPPAQRFSDAAPPLLDCTVPLTFTPLDCGSQTRGCCRRFSPFRPPAPTNFPLQNSVWFALYRIPSQYCITSQSPGPPRVEVMVSRSGLPISPVYFLSLCVWLYRPLFFFGRPPFFPPEIRFRAINACCFDWQGVLVRFFFFYTTAYLVYLFRALLFYRFHPTIALGFTSPVSWFPSHDFRRSVGLSLSPWHTL